MKVAFRKVCFMDMENKFLTMVTSILETSLKDSDMERAFSNLLMEIYMRVTGKMICKMDMAF